jgi:hypothetical protein
MRLAIRGEEAAIEPGEQPQLGQFLRQALPLLPGLIAEAGGAGRNFCGGPRLGVVEAALARVAA